MDNVNSQNDSQQNASGKNQKNFRITLAYLLLNRYTLIISNLLAIVFLGIGVWDVGESLLGDMKNVDDLSKVMCGTGSTIVSYGIVLEERSSLMNIFRCYPYYQNKKESVVDHNCNDYGIVLLVIGLFLEITQQFFEIPNDVIDTDGHEPYLFGVGCILMVITILHLMRFSYSLIKLKNPVSQQNSTEGN